jgi:flavin reductase (DIM6/NTAB) family NADH-FMN oxidoreductase RutF
VSRISEQDDSVRREGVEHDCMDTGGQAAAAGRGLVELSTATPIWDRVFTVAPLVLVATKEGDGWDVAPKHLALPLGWENRFGFACSERHATYRNVVAHPEFTVSFPRADRILDVTMAAGARAEDGSKPTLSALSTFAATTVDGVLVEGCDLYLECALERVVDGFGPNSLVVGRIVAAAAAPEALRTADGDDADVVHRRGLLVYVDPGRFGIVRETYSLPFPAGFSR